MNPSRTPDTVLAAYERFCTDAQLDPNTTDAFDEWATEYGEHVAELTAKAVGVKYPGTDPTWDGPA
jgi:hypothetical protein